MVALSTSGASRLIREFLDEKPFTFYDMSYELTGFVRTACIEGAIEVHEYKSAKVDKLYRRNRPVGKSSYRVSYYVGGPYKIWEMSETFSTFAKAMDFYAGQAYSSMKAWENE